LKQGPRSAPWLFQAVQKWCGTGLVARLSSFTVGPVAVSDEGTDVYPESYHQMLCPPVAEPPFDDPAELARVWGERWGSVDEVGTLRSVLLRRPGRELEQIRADAWNPAARALVDPHGGWYWESEEPPDLTLVAQQHEALVDALEAEDVEVHFAAPLEERFTKAIYTRDPLVSVPGGVIVGRLAPLMRRGEERSITQAVGALGIPILRTITGTGLFEGGSFAKLTPRVAAFGTSIRCNDEAASQLAEILKRLGIELIVVPMSGYSIHLDGHFAMVDVDKALVDPTGLPYWFLEKLAELGIEAIWCHPEEGWAINSLAVRPGRILMCEGNPRTAERLVRRGVEAVTLPYDEIQKNGGGIHCSTMELRRDPA
jgi:N-dimethylarginine dimethylaminohydrolase